jgi:hypothetical protein
MLLDEKFDERKKRFDIKNSFLLPLLQREMHAEQKKHFSAFVS